jgi:uncharacterized hydrophobic protein (TIGR00271 family)
LEKQHPLKRTRKVILGRQELSDLNSEERRQLVGSLFFRHNMDRMIRFWILLFLSLVIATYGMLADNTAVVIGAMLLSPLMTPTMGFAASLVMVWPKRLSWSAALLVIATGGCVAVAFLLTEISPLAHLQVLPDEVLSRTSPSFTDLIIAIAAGTAGAIAAIREDVSAAIPGVAISVAMVPPLASAGILLGVGESSLAAKAMLLYTTNIVAIILAAGIVLLASGFVPRGRAERFKGQLALGLGIVTLTVVIIAVPLYRALEITIDHAQVTAAAHEAVDDWLGDARLELTELNVTHESAEVILVGVDRPPDIDKLSALMEEDLGMPIDVEVTWYRGETQEAFSDEEGDGEETAGDSKPD